MSSHLAAATTAKGQLNVIEVPTEAPKPGEVQIKVEYGAMIPPDVYAADRGLFVPSYPSILGFSSAGTVSQIADDVQDVKVGDKVTAFNYGPSHRKALQEFVNVPATVVGKVPKSFPSEQAATIPDNFVTAYYTLFNQLGLPNPSELPATTPPPNASTPILIYGGGASSGQYMIQLLALAGYKKILATASKHNHDYLLSLGATDVIDYSDPGLVEAIAKAAGGNGKIPLAVDCISSEATSMTVLTKVISPSGKVALLLPLKEGHSVTNGEDEEMYWEVRENKTPFPTGTKIILVRTFNYQEDTFLRDNLMPKILPKLLESGALKPNRPLLMDKGSFSDRVKAGLEVLRTNQAKGGKVIVKITA